MEINIALEELRRIIETAFGITLTDQQFAFIVIILLLGSLGIVSSVWKFLKGLWIGIEKLFLRFGRDQATKDFIRMRNRFANHLIIEIERLNQETDWNDFYYTKLQAQVEIEPQLDTFKNKFNFLITWIYSIPSLVRLMLGFVPAGELVDNLTEAIIHSRSRSFLVIGDPGSGKTVSLKHLALNMAKECSTSNKSNAVVPLYFNLKVLNVRPEEINADLIRGWMLKQLTIGQDRLISQFLEKHFDYMLQNGYFFILFDSFDEIPAVMDSSEDTEVVKIYALALSRFLHAPHGCRGLVSSRPYRAPKTFVGQKIFIKPLSIQRIEDALKNYLVHHTKLASSMWIRIVRERDDLLQVASNPFLLGLLARYISETQELPSRKYDLYEHFLQVRVRADAQKLQQLGFSSEEIIILASQLAFLLTKAPDMGLEARVYDITGFHEKLDMSEGKVENLLEALTYSKISRLSQRRGDSQNTFSFVHRRFQEYFCARYLLKHRADTPFEYLFRDNRWREVLVLLCEVMPATDLAPLLSIASDTIAKGMLEGNKQREHRNAIETLRFLRDGFRPRLDDLPKELVVRATSFIQQQLMSGHILDQKRGVECLILADKNVAPQIIENALQSGSSWLKETVLYSCRTIATPTSEINRRIRMYLFDKYSNLDLVQEFRFLSILLSFPKSFLPFRSYLFMLGLSIVSQTAIIFGFLFLISLNGLIDIFFTSILAGVFLFIGITFMNRAVLHADAIVEKDTLRDKQTPQDAYNRVLSKIINKTTSYTSSLDSYTEQLANKIFSGHVIQQRKNEKAYSFLRFIVNRTLSFWIMYDLVLFFSVLIIVIQRSMLLESLSQSGALIFLRALLFFSLPLNFILLILIIDYPQDISAFGWIRFIFERLLMIVKRLFSKNTILMFLLAPLFAVNGLIQMILIAFFFILIFIISVLMFPYNVYTGIRDFVNFLVDQTKLTRMIVSSIARPQTGHDAAVIFDSLKSETAKIQFARYLPKWIPVSGDWNLIIERAKRESVNVQDVLFRVCEMWQDSTDN